MLHPAWQRRAYPVTFFTTAPLEVLQAALAGAEAERAAALAAEGGTAVPEAEAAVVPAAPAAGVMEAKVAAAQAQAQAQAQAVAVAAHEEEAARFGRSTASFNSALIACVECGQLEQASALLQRMRETGVRLNALSYTAGISAAQRQVC